MSDLIAAGPVVVALVAAGVALYCLVRSGWGNGPGPA